MEISLEMITWNASGLTKHKSNIELTTKISNLTMDNKLLLYKAIINQF